MLGEARAQLIQSRQISDARHVKIRPYVCIARISEPIALMHAVGQILEFAWPQRTELCAVVENVDIGLTIRGSRVEKVLLRHLQLCGRGSPAVGAREQQYTVAVASQYFIQALVLTVCIFDHAVWRSIASEYGPTEAGACPDNRALPVADCKLRDELVAFSSPFWSTCHVRDDPRHNEVADVNINGVRPGQPGENPVCRVEEVLADRVALLVIGVEKRIRTFATKDGTQLPPQVDGILYTGVHSLAADRRVDMRSVTGHKKATIAVGVDAHVVQRVACDPGRVIELTMPRFHGVKQLLKILEVRLTLWLADAAGDNADHVILEWENDQHPLTEAQEQVPPSTGLGRPETCVTEDEILLIHSAIKCEDIRGMPHGAMGPVGTNNVLYVHCFLCAGRLFEDGGDSTAVLSDILDSNTTLESGAILSQAFMEDSLCIGLCDDKRRRVHTVLDLPSNPHEIHVRNLPAFDNDSCTTDGYTRIEQLSAKAMSSEQLLTASLHSQSLGLLGKVRRHVDNAKGDALEGEFETKGKASGATTNDKNVCLLHDRRWEALALQYGLYSYRVFVPECPWRSIFHLCKLRLADEERVVQNIP